MGSCVLTFILDAFSSYGVLFRDRLREYVLHKLDILRGSSFEGKWLIPVFARGEKEPGAGMLRIHMFIKYLWSKTERRE